MASIGFPKRAVALGVAVILAGVATVALVSYVRGVETRVAEANEAVEAYVAKDVIPAGTTGEQAVAQGLIVRQAVPRRLVADSAVTSLDQLEGRVASADVLPGEQILSARFVQPDQISTKILNIPEDKQALSIQVGVPNGVAQFIQRGAHVSIIAELDSPDAAEAGEGATPEQQAAAEQASARVKYLLQDVEVLAVGQRVVVTQTGEGENQVQQTQDQVMLTLALDPASAEKLALAIFQGQVYFTLLPEGQEPVETTGQTLETVFN